MQMVGGSGRLMVSFAAHSLLPLVQLVSGGYVRNSSEIPDFAAAAQVVIRQKALHLAAHA